MRHEEYMKMREQQANKQSDNVVVRPSHYERWAAIEPICFIMLNHVEFWRGNVVKYVMRAGGKKYDGMDANESEIQDLKKAMRYCQMRINQIEGKQPNDT